ncbi:site-specific DNA-methyltransferase [Sphingomonas sp. CFBP 13720]|uniref:site-specific DNA-methyltransferase n=1 Tax=Sphingomonas sp. CFBP 13720 TaxID=2775302 RepID=UPI00178500AE|nr:DNA methyltransferase [Sphingomonas sp. CFBP 13720]MBD8678316.1 ParB N-terminal domain-containing protein [Sphingomonas sp. CFBP 13720]
MSKMPDYKIHLRAPSELKARADNPRVHSRKQVRTIMISMRQFGVTHPILIDDQDQIIAGHGRVLAALELELSTIPTISLKHLTKSQLKAFMIADNRTAELATWDRELLAQSFAEIEFLDGELDLSVTGFQLEEIDLLVDFRSSRTPKAEDEIPPLAVDAISCEGDVWVFADRHRLLCGDATVAASYITLLGIERVDMVVTDPPWNCPIQGHVSGLGKHKHREFVAASGEMTSEEFRRFLEAFMTSAEKVSRSGSLHYIFCDWRILGDVLSLGESIYHQMVNLAVWAKTNAGMGSFMRSQHELVTIFKKGRRAHINNVNLGVDGRHRSNVWTFAGANSFGLERDAALAMHPTVKPVLMIAEAIKDASHRDDLILDPFAGSGTSLIACHDTGRRARLMELDPLYVDVICARAMRHGMSVILASSGQTYEEVREDRKVLDA